MIDWHLAVRLGIHHATTKEGLEDSSNGDCKKAVGKFISKLITQSTATRSFPQITALKHIFP